MIVSIEKPEESDISKVYLMLGPACNLKCRHCYQTDVPMPRLHKTIHEDVWKFLKYLKEIHGQLPVCKCSGDFLSLFALLRAKCTP